MIAMNKMNRKGRNKDRYVGLPHRLLDSPAFLALTPHAATLYLYLERRYNGFNNGEISLSCREGAKKLKSCKDTASKAFKELIATGFIKVTVESAFNMKQRKARRWALTRHPMKSGISPTNDWRDWKAENSENGRQERTESPASRTKEENQFIKIGLQSGKNDTSSLSEKRSVG
jgi:hypothetical protein